MSFDTKVYFQKVSEKKKMLKHSIFWRQFHARGLFLEMFREETQSIDLGVPACKSLCATFSNDFYCFISLQI